MAKVSRGVRLTDVSVNIGLHGTQVLTGRSMECEEPMRRVGIM